MLASLSQLHAALEFLSSHGLTAYSFFYSLLQSNEYRSHTAVIEVIDNMTQLLDAISSYHPSGLEWAMQRAEQEYYSEISQLTKKEAGLHFIAKHITDEKLREFQIKDIAKLMEGRAPRLWNLSYILQDPMAAQYRVRQKDLKSRHFDMDETWTEISALRTIKQITCISILANSSNQRCNALQSVIGIFLHACNTPEAVCEFLARVGLSVSITTINAAIENLSRTAVLEIRKLGQTMSMIIAYDNVDVNLKHSVPTIEQSSDSLVHLTSGTLIPLYGVGPDDLNCYDGLENYRAGVPSVSLKQLLQLGANISNHPAGLFHHQQFNCWKFLHDLVHHGPDYFQKFRYDVGQPDVVEQIPVHKSSQVPLTTVDVWPSTPVSNAEALGSFFHQAGLGNGSSHDSRLRDPKDRILLVFGDLLTGERLRSLLESRSAEATRWQRLDWLVFVMGLFHLKMACADAIWRILIRDVPKIQADSSCLLELIAVLREKESAIFGSGSGPNFRRLHDAIQHVGTVMRLDCWRLQALKKNVKFQSLNDFADTKPDWTQLETMATEMCQEYVGTPNIIDELRNEADMDKRDGQHENTLILHQYFLMYEEITHAMNVGDIGRVEGCFIPWMAIFNTCGKTKYAAELRRYLEDIHFRLPDSVSRAIRMNILCNPTGKQSGFRGIDWLVEHNNLYIKRIYGGKLSNYTKARIIKESPLIEVFKNIRMQFEEMFCLDHKTRRHSSPDMRKTFLKLARYIVKHKINEYVENRATEHEIPNALGIGIEALSMKDTNTLLEALVSTDDRYAELPDEQDVVDDGDLDV